MNAFAFSGGNNKDDNDDDFEDYKDSKLKKHKVDNENAFLGVPEVLLFKPTMSIISSWYQDEAYHKNESVAIALLASWHH